jgi:hypothetical protein
VTVLYFYQRAREGEKSKFSLENARDLCLFIFNREGKGPCDHEVMGSS